MKNIRIVKKIEGNNYFRRNINFYNSEDPDDDITNLLKNNPLKVKSILEIGCANGVKLDQYRTILNTKKNYGIDLSRKAIIQGGKKFDKLKLFKLSSLEINKIKTKFDLIICGFFLYLLDREEIFKQFDLIYKKLNTNGYMIIHDYSPLFKHTNKSIHNKKLNSFKMSYDNFLQESGLFKMIYKSTKNKTLVKKKHDLKKFKSDEISLSLYQKIDFIKTYPENI